MPLVKKRRERQEVKMTARSGSRKSRKLLKEVATMLQRKILVWFHLLFDIVLVLIDSFTETYRMSRRMADDPMADYVDTEN